MSKEPFHFNVDLTKIDKISKKQKECLLTMLQILSSVDDGAFSKDSQGFNANDTILGNDLAACKFLTAETAKYAKSLLFKYWRQFPSDLFDVVYGKGVWERLKVKAPPRPYTTNKGRKIRDRSYYDIDEDYYDNDYDDEPGDFPY
jgi:hypothetical protein